MFSMQPIHLVMPVAPPNKVSKTTPTNTPVWCKSKTICLQVADMIKTFKQGPVVWVATSQKLISKSKQFLWTVSENTSETTKSSRQTDYLWKELQDSSESLTKTFSHGNKENLDYRQRDNHTAQTKEVCFCSLRSINKA